MSELKERLWDKFCNYSLELDGKQTSDYYGGATVMLEWLIGELWLDEPDELVNKIVARIAYEMRDMEGTFYRGEFIKWPRKKLGGK